MTIGADARRLLDVPRALTAGLVLLAACATSVPSHDYAIEPGQEGAPRVTSVLLAPMNAFSGIPEELEEGANRAFAATRGYLEEHGKAVRTVSLFEFRRTASGVASKTGQDDELAFRRDLVAALRESHEFDVLVLPDLAIRPAKLASRSVRWDGVRRRAPGPPTYVWEGSTTAASLHVRVVGSDGTQLFEGIGGLDVLFEPNIREERMVLIEGLLSDPEHLREGVRVAFHPYLAPLP